MLHHPPSSKPSKPPSSAPPLLPPLPPKKSRQLDPSWINLKPPTEQSILLQIQDINSTLQHKNFTCHLGNLFSSELNDKVITELHVCLKRPSAVMEDGFSLWNTSKTYRKSTNSEFKRLSQKIDTLNEKMVQLSMQNVYDYDLYKYLQILKYNKNVWSLYKRLNPNPINPQTPNQPHINHNQSNLTSNHITLSPNSKYHPHSKIPHPQTKSQTIQKIKIHKQNLQIKTTVQDNPEQQQQTQQISKYDVKNMLKKQGDFLIFMYLPPSTYPLFNGMFTYTATAKSPSCKLKKYFFFKRSLNPRFFNAIIEQISRREDKYIEAIELTTNRNDYSKVYEPLGWKMKSLEGIDQFRIKFNRESIMHL